MTTRQYNELQWNAINFYLFHHNERMGYKWEEELRERINFDEEDSVSRVAREHLFNKDTLEGLEYWGFIK